MAQEISNDLLDGLKRKEEKALAYVYKNWFPSLYVFVFKIICDEQESRDIVIDSLVELWKNPDRISDPRHLNNFLFLCARNRALNYLRHKEVEHEYEKAVQDELSALEASLEANVFERELLQKVYLIINELPPKMRRVIELIYIEGHTPVEAAEILGKSVSTVYTQRDSAIEFIRDNMGPDFMFFLIWMYCQ